MKTFDLIDDLHRTVERAKVQGNTSIPVGEIEECLDMAERVASAREDVDVEAMPRNDANPERFKSAIAAGQAALKAAIVINGGAAAAMLAFLGNFLTTDVEDVNMLPVSGIGAALLIFLLGVGCAGCSSGIHSLAQAAYAWGWKKSGHALNWAMVVIGLASFSAFFLGSIWAYLAIVFHHDMASF
jgi:hypothetical protein